MTPKPELDTPLALMLYQYRHYYRISVRKLGHEIGVSGSTISRIESGHAVDANTLLLLMRWMLQADK